MNKYFSIFFFLCSILCFSQEPDDKIIIDDYKIVEVMEEPSENTEVPFAIVEDVPIYRGCDESLDNIALKKCMSSKISEFVAKKFNQKIIDKLDLPPGKVRIFVTFKIDAKGKIKDIASRAPHKKLEEEAIRVISKIPKMKKPGYQRDKPVTVPYTLPMLFTVQ